MAKDLERSLVNTTKTGQAFFAWSDALGTLFKAGVQVLAIVGALGFVLACAASYCEHRSGKLKKQIREQKNQEK